MLRNISTEQKTSLSLSRSTFSLFYSLFLSDYSNSFGRVGNRRGLFWRNPSPRAMNMSSILRRRLESIKQNCPIKYHSIFWWLKLAALYRPNYRRILPQCRQGRRETMKIFPFLSEIKVKFFFA